jgi:DNA-binding FadR family transcriptional regulator
MEVRQIKKRGLVERLVAEVRGQISAGHLAEGQQLPTEARMAAEFGVSRPLLREALAELRAEGFVQTVNGRGTFVRHPGEADLADALVRQLQLSGREPELTVDHLYQARQAIETSAAALAAQRATPDMTATLDRLLHAMADSGGDAAAYTAADVGFHVAVARATENPIFPALLAPIATMIIKGMFESHGTPDAVRLGIEAHARILDAIKCGQPEAARKAMAEHLAESRTIFPEQAIRPRSVRRRTAAS